MYRRLLINIYQVRNGLIHTQNPRPPFTKCKEGEFSSSSGFFWPKDKASQRLLGTSSIAFSENKDNTTSSSQDKKTEGNESVAEVIKDEQKKTEIQNEGTETSKEAWTSQTEAAKPEESKPHEKTKTGKENLLELLGAMKVEVTTKRKIRPPKIVRTSERPEPKTVESAHSMFQQATAEGSPQREILNPELVAAASAAASTLPNSHQAESELLQQLRKHEAIPDTQKRAEGQNIGDIIADMKVGKRQNGRTSARPTSQIRFDDDGRGYTQDRGITSELDAVRRRKSPFTGKRLNIFAAVEQDAVSDLSPTLWDIELANQIVQSTNQIPRNGFEEMIQWTREGKLWQYPINNEAGLEEEARVPFHEHVFLEKYLDDSFPRQGPVRHFMELVITGLAKNHHLTVKQKQEHIAWFRDYFQQKDSVLKEAEA
ncbi:28S ribosomal protein S31, mitochondrial [Triplophysa rosa]|uniref:Small ribosomal subunit protein mS31 n=1 Tax=Triplophysa rosa TaxID=992332 RepID=A0A9W7X3Z0_TRIRA|nr:28S ribosomal protein S31, mitochondrial [Triplophysa rosa]KAI7813682.1 28S ribosomal protein S31 [Triplophysa rosa]